MNIANVIAEVFGIVFTVMGLSVLLNKKAMLGLLEQTIQSQTSLWLCGSLLLVMGSVSVVLNNVWSSGLQLFVTIIGWLVLLKAMMILIFPKFSVSLYRKLSKDGIMVFGGLAALILGLILFYSGMM